MSLIQLMPVLDAQGPKPCVSQAGMQTTVLCDHGNHQIDDLMVVNLCLSMVSGKRGHHAVAVTHGKGCTSRPIRYAWAELGVMHVHGKFDVDEKEFDLQGAGGCADMQWRQDSDGYLKKVLTASIYDVAVSYNYFRALTSLGSYP